MKRVRVDPEAVRKANREAASKEELIKALEVISDGADEEEQHKAGVHRFIVNGDCTGNNSEEACYITCSWCYEGEHPVENTELDPTKTDGSRICFDCLDKMDNIHTALGCQWPAIKKQKVKQIFHFGGGADAAVQATQGSSSPPDLKKKKKVRVAF